jgi:hypothetical protein
MSREDDIIATWGREFAIAIDDIAQANRQDGYEVYHAVFGKAPMLDTLRNLTEAQLGALRDAARTIMETDAIDATHVAEAVKATIWNWTQ